MLCFNYFIKEERLESNDLPMQLRSEERNHRINPKKIEGKK